jgi:hypothetical protein
VATVGQEQGLALASHLLDDHVAQTIIEEKVAGSIAAAPATAFRGIFHADSAMQELNIYICKS